MKHTRLLPPLGALPLVALAIIGCGSNPEPVPDAGIDDSCGIDCEAQRRFGLIAERCFEYSDTQDAQESPTIGAFVRPVRELEGGVKVIPVEYSESGVGRMEDLFMIVGGELRLARRTFTASGDRVDYRDESSNVIGVTWLQPDTTAGQNFSSQAQADVLAAGQRTTQATTFTVVASAPTQGEQRVPQGTFPESVKLLFNESRPPPHGLDARRVFQKDLGFTLFSSSFSLTGTSPREFRLQGVRDVGTEDGGTYACGFAAP